MPQTPQPLFPPDSVEDASAIAAHLAVAARTSHYDELRGSGRTGLTPSWKHFFNLLGADGIADLDHHVESTVRQLQENGVTYNVYADADTGGSARAWSLDLLPRIITPDDWGAIERGVIQRAGLLDAILADAYGPQHLLKEGYLPPALVMGHPGYLRPLHGHVPPGGTYLHIVAFDLARAADGSWSVVSQRTQAPSGLGYVLENRLTISRLFPQAFHELRVQHLASAYRALMDNLYRLSPAEGGSDHSRHSPRIVLLTPGPYNETYFEHVYLARYLGITLVEGGDLTVRDERVFLKTLYGLERVHAILRRLDDDFCDPLELRSDSTLGVTGLLQAVRAGNVLVANALGASFLESPGINGFLPAIAERLLGAPLMLPSLPSWWCGEAAACKQILPRLGDLVVKPTYPNSVAYPAFEPVIGDQAAPATLAAWCARILAAPDAHTVQAYLPLSQTPTWSGGRIVPCAAMLRVFAVADLDAEGQRTWRVLPGGLTRVAKRDQQVVSMQRGGSSQDTWVMSAAEVDTFSLLPQQLRPEDLAAKRRPISSRAAENLFWVGRYAERADHSVRMARLALLWLTGDADAPGEFLAVLQRVCRRSGLVPADVPSAASARRIFERTLVAGLLESEEGGAVGLSLAALCRSAGHIRDRLSAEHWRLIRGAHVDFEARLATLHAGGDFSSIEALAALDWLGTQIAAVTGAQADRMTRDDGWRHLTIGRQIERLSSMCEVLQEVFDTTLAHRDNGFKLLLEAFDSAITYRAHYQRRLEMTALLDLLVIDPENPRSLACCVTTLRSEMTRLPRSVGVFELATLLPDPASWDLAALVESDEEGRHQKLAILVTELIDVAHRLSDEIGQRYFSHASELDHAVLR